MAGSSSGQPQPPPPRTRAFDQAKRLLLDALANGWVRLW